MLCFIILSMANYFTNLVRSWSFSKFCELLLKHSSARKYWIETCVWSIRDTTVIQCNKKDLKVLVNFRSSYQGCSIEKAVLKNFATFTGKHLYWSLLLIKDSTQVFSCEYCENFMNSYFEERLPTAASETFWWSN